MFIFLSNEYIIKKKNGFSKNCQIALTFDMGKLTFKRAFKLIKLNPYHIQLNFNIINCSTIKIKYYLLVT